MALRQLQLVKQVAGAVQVRVGILLLVELVQRHQFLAQV